MDTNSFAIVNVLNWTQIRQVWLEFLFDCQSIVWTQMSYDVRHLSGQQRSIIAANMITILSRNAQKVLIYCKVKWFDIMNLYQYVDTIAFGISENASKWDKERKRKRENPFEFFCCRHSSRKCEKFLKDAYHFIYGDWTVWNVHYVWEVLWLKSTSPIFMTSERCALRSHYVSTCLWLAFFFLSL